MPEPTPRMRKLLSMLQKQPDDTFILYALAMEYRKANELGEALAYMKRVIGSDAAYLAAYHQSGQVHEQLGDFAAAEAAYASGVIAATKKGDNHARDEMGEALAAVRRRSGGQ